MLERKCASQDRLGEERYVSKVLLILAVKMYVFLKLRQANLKHNPKLLY